MAARGGDQYDVFISYSRRNIAQVTLIRDRLQALGLKVFFDTEGIEGGAEFTEVLDRAVKGARTVLACWSHEALTRRWVRIESRIGLDRGTLVATAIEPMTHEDLPAEFYNVNVIDLIGFRGQEDDPGWQAVLRAIGRRTGRNDLAKSAGGDAPLVGRGKVRRKRGGWLGKAIAAFAVIGLLGAGAWYGARELGLIAASPGNLSPADLARRFEAQIARAEPILEAGAEGRVAEISERAFPRSIWAAAQLVSVAPDLSADARALYDETVGDLIDGGCRCVVIDGAPLAIVSGWIVFSYTEAGQAPPGDALEALLDAQNPRGWWSSALNAEDRASNASLYATAFVAFALGRAEERLDGGRRREVAAARQRAVTWLRTLRPSDAGLWSDYPDNAQRNENVVFAAMMTVILLQGAEGAEAERIAAQYLAALPEISPPERNFSFDTLVTMEGGEPYVDTFRHLPMGWETHALALAYRHLDDAGKARAAEMLAAAAAHPLDEPELARQEWIVAEAVFGIRFAIAALRGD